MYISNILLVSLFALSIDASPVLTEKPIPDDQLERLNGLGARSLESKPIPDDQLKRLETFERRSNLLYERDSRLDCQKTVTTGGTESSISKAWVPVGNIEDLITQFCRSAQDTDLHKGHEVSDSYGTTLTNQDDDKQKGADGNVVFGIYNIFKSDSTYIVEYDSCVDAMKKQTNDDSLCYGKTHKDTRGGYWKVDDVGYFGFETYAGSLSKK
ncbi:MAG: hypothetical protein Q9222_001906 [Ikaeria aurantiellina]